MSRLETIYVGVLLTIKGERWLSWCGWLSLVDAFARGHWSLTVYIWGVRLELCPSVRSQRTAGRPDCLPDDTDHRHL